MDVPTLLIGLLIVGLLISILFLWRNNLQSLGKRIGELEKLSAAGQAIAAAQLDMDRLCELIAAEAGEVINSETFQIGLFEESFYTILYWCINQEKQPTPQTFDLNDGESMVSWVRQTKRPLLIPDFLADNANLPAQVRYISDFPPRSAVYLPLTKGNDVIGIMAAQSEFPNRFREEDMRLLMIIANQAAAAIANAQLFAQESHRAAQLELVSEIANRAHAAQNLDELFQQVVELTHKLFNFHPVSIVTLDHDGNATIRASSAPQLIRPDLIIGTGGIVGIAIDTRHTVVSNNTSEDIRFVAHIGPVEENPAELTRSEIAVPLIVDDEVLGVLDVQSREVGAFSGLERTVLETLGAQVSSAIYKAQQLAFQQEQAWLTTAQLQVANVISQSESMDELTTAVSRLTAMLAGVPLCGILIWNDEQEHYQGVSLHGATDSRRDAFQQRSFGIGDWSTLDAAHLGHEPMVSHQIPPWLKAVGTQPLQHLCLTPLKATHEAVVGMLLTGSYEEGQPEQHSDLLNMISQQVAQSIEAALLRKAQQEEAWVNTALFQVAEAVNNLLDLNDILDSIVRLMPILVGVDSAVILFWDEQREKFSVGSSYGISEMGLGLLETLEIDQEEFLDIAGGSTSISPKHEAKDDIWLPGRQTGSQHYLLSLPHWLRQTMGTTEAHAIPLHARGRLVGMLLIGLRNEARENGRFFSSRRLNILHGIAHQAATAVVNNQLYAEAAERDRLDQELNLAREIQASILPQGSPSIPGADVASYWMAARQVSGDFFDFLELRNGQWGIVVADVADKGIPASIYMALSRTILRTIGFNRMNPAEVLERTNTILDKDTASDLFVTAFYGMWSPEEMTFTFANAGHNPPLVVRKNGRFSELNGDGIALGVLPEIQIERLQISLGVDDLVVLYTDGVTEAMNEDYDEFGVERLRLVVQQNRKRSARAIRDAITNAIWEHTGDSPQFDDITLIVFKCLAPPTPTDVL